MSDSVSLALITGSLTTIEAESVSMENEAEGKAKPGQLKRSTLQERLTKRGFSTHHMRMYATGGVAARRFQKRHRNQLWQSDIKYGPYLPIGPGGSNKQVYLVLFIDDATRYVLHGEFYPTMDQSIVEDCFRKSIQQHAVPEAVYFDYTEKNTMPKKP